MLKVLHNFFSSKIVLPSSFRTILSLFKLLFEKVGTTVLQNVLLSVIFLVTKLLKPLYILEPLDYTYHVLPFTNLVFVWSKIPLFILSISLGEQGLDL